MGETFSIARAKAGLYRGLNSYLYYFGGVPSYNYGIIYPKTLF